MSPAVRFFLSRALSPQVQAGSRWTAVNASTRRAYVVAGKDAGSPFLRWLAEGRPERSAEFARAAEQLGLDDSVEGQGFVGWYRQLNFDYPFLNYAAEDGRRIDTELMDAYSGGSSPPAPATDRQGESRPLVATGVEVSPDGAAQEPTEALVAAWLQAVAGYNATSPGRRGPILHRTSPSGGARHPTDIGVALGSEWGELAGEWWYEPIAHALVAGPLPFGVEDAASSLGAVFTVTSHVQRAMWRYRDVRAFRPVLYDAGHIVETLIQVIRLAGWSARWVPRPMFIESSGVLDATIGFVLADPNGHPNGTAKVAPPRPNREELSLRTNPLLSVAFEAGRTVIVNHLAPRAPVEATGPMLDALAYATPSSRRDRPTDPIAIADATSADAEALAELRAAGLLMPESEGDDLWSGLAPWTRHDWFLSALMHAEATASGTRPRDPRADHWKDPRRTRMLPAALDGRRTCRSMKADPLPDAAADRLLAVLYAGSEVQLVLSTPTGLGDIPIGVHVVSPSGAEMLRDQALPGELITHAAIGQPWARGFSCAIWLLPQFGEGTAGDWEAHLVACGRLAQRITLAVSQDSSVGVFQSPAMVDAELAELLPDFSVVDGAYLVGVGMAKPNAADSRDRAFLSQDLFRGPAT